jgi:hypothetical protein
MENAKLFIRYVLSTLLFMNTVSCVQSQVKVGSVYKKTLADQLDSILVEDQRYRQMLSGVEAKYGLRSPEKLSLVNKMRAGDSINILKITSILDKYGWLGPEVIGENGNSCLYVIIQHSDLKTQETYLPKMRLAVKDGKAKASEMAFLEDRVALRQGKKQIYGTQLRRNDSTLIFYFAPIEDERNVNKRRESVGLGKLEDRAREFGFEYILPK